MTTIASIDAYGRLTEPDTLTMHRLLPGNIERVWAYLTESELRRKWLAAGEMEMAAGTAFTLTWRNDDLTSPAGTHPPGFTPGAEHSMESKILELDPPHHLVFAWGGEGGTVTIDLEQKGGEVLLTLIHRRLPDGDMKLKICTGWHTHLNILAARIEGSEPDPMWDMWSRLFAEYVERQPV